MKSDTISMKKVLVLIVLTLACWQLLFNALAFSDKFTRVELEGIQWPLDSTDDVSMEAGKFRNITGDVQVAKNEEIWLWQNDSPFWFSTRFGDSELLGIENVTTASTNLVYNIACLGSPSTLHGRVDGNWFNSGEGTPDNPAEIWIQMARGTRVPKPGNYWNFICTEKKVGFVPFDIGGSVNTQMAGVYFEPFDLLADTTVSIESTFGPSPKMVPTGMQKYVISAHSFEPSGLPFTGPVQVTLSYTDAGVYEAEIFEKSLTPLYFNSSRGKWEKLVASDVDIQNNRVTFYLTEFSSTYALGGEPPPPLGEDTGGITAMGFLAILVGGALLIKRPKYA